MLTNLSKEEIYSIPGKMTGHYYHQIDTIIDTWTSSLFVALEDWKATVYDIGIAEFAPNKRVKNWIIDTSQARSVFPPAVQEFSEKEAKPKLEEMGLQRLIVILPATGIGKFSASKIAEIYDGEAGMKSYELENMDQAMELIKR